MTSQTQPGAPFSRFSRVGFGMGLISRSRTGDSNGGAAGGEDEWYIPYTGPYEPPREPPRRQKARDSWGDPVEGEDIDAILVNAEFHNQYGGYARGRGDDERKSHTRDRTHSAVSRGTPSSGEPSRTSIGMRRRSTVSGNRPTVPSYINPSTSGGVGESPTPHLRTTKEANRLSLASIFSFSSGRKSPTSSPLVRDRSLHKAPSKKVPQLTRPNTSSGGQEDLGDSSQSPALRRSSSTNEFKSKSPLFERQRSNPPRNNPEASTPDDEDYYNSYYSTLIRSPQHETTRQKQHSRNNSLAEPFQQRSRLNSPVSRRSSTSPTYSHPYAYAFPTSDIPTPTSPQESGLNNFQQQRADPPRLTFTTPHIGNGNADTLHYASTLRLTGDGVRQLKNSASTPNLRSPSPKISPTRQNPPDDPPPPMFALPKGKDRWLSAETWCDALLFPRPRLKVKQDENGYVGSGRIVSPPGTPLVDEFGMNRHQDQGVVSRVLAHSRSLVDLSIHASPSKSLRRKRLASTSRVLDNAPVAVDLNPRRPTSFAQDDLALLSPASSLSKVLAEGQLLSSQRQQWQLQATKSFENKRSRSISRTRSKSLTQRGRREAQPSQTGLDFLAARAYLGNQSAVPVVVAPKSHRKNSSYSATGTTTTSSSRPSHSYSGSLVKTLSKSSKSHSRGHSRTGEDAVAPYAVDEKASGLEGALRREGTKFIRLADPAKIPVDKEKVVLRYSRPPTPRVSPTPSGMTDSKVGIALSTPPPMNEELDHDSIRLPAHPYAQGGLYSFSNNPITPVNDVRHVRGSDYAGPHPSRTTSPRSETSSLSTRHKLPPHLGLHPYAQTSANAEEGLVPQARSDSNIPPQSKMWAQLSPGVVREILPGDIQYSPFSPDRSDRLQSPVEIHDIIGVGEALAYPGVKARSANDAEIVDERSGTPSSGKQSQSGQRLIASGMQRLQDDLPEFGPRPRREPVLYDARRPVYAQHLSDSPSGFPSSLKKQLSQQLTIPVDPQASTPSPAVTSESSSPYLQPRPLGSPNDLENFHDLFYKPSIARPSSSELKSSVSPPPQVSPAPWGVHTRNRSTGSGLTSLARQLSEEFEQMALERERTSSQYSYSASSMLASNNTTQRPTDGSLRFVFEESPHPESPTSILEEFSSAHGPTLAFKPSGTLPEDVESSRASSVIPQGEEDDDDTAMFRVGMVESVSTPPATEHHLSLMGQTADVLEPYHHSDAITSESHARVLSGLQPPVTEGTRSSYMTTSTLSRMSGLSDFPIPPRDPLTPRHMSLLTSYFDEAMAQNEIQSLQDSRMPHGRRLTFGVNQDAEDVAEALSSDSHGHT